LGSFAFCGCVALDGTVGKILGSVLFSVGLFLVCFAGVNLYTGKIGFAPEAIRAQGWRYVFDLLLMLGGNFVGASGSGALINLAFRADSSNKILAVAQSIAANRSCFGDSCQPWYKAFVMGIFCGMLVFLAVYVWKKSDNWFIKATGLILCVTTFVVTGTEHCIANMFYFGLAGAWNLGNFFDILIVIAGNSVGSLVLFYLFALVNHARSQEPHQA
jgi:formate transporter